MSPLTSHKTESSTTSQRSIPKKKVRPIQMGEFLRKYVSRPLLALIQEK